jgi:hypothetical protein
MMANMGYREGMRLGASGHVGPYLFEGPPTKAITALDRL